MYSGVHIYIRKIEKRIREINTRLYAHRTPVEDVSFFETMEHMSVEDVVKNSRFKSCKVGLKWGRQWSTAWFRLRVRIPGAMTGNAVSLRFRCDNSTSVLFHKGIPLQGLDQNRDEIRLTENAKGSERYEFLVEATPGTNHAKYHGQAVLSKIELCTVNKIVREYYYTLVFLFKLALELPEDLPRRKRLLRAINQSVDAFDYSTRDETTLERAAGIGLERLKDVRLCEAEASMPTAHLIGHAHLDLAWHWRYSETIRKCARTFSTVLNYMEEYPEFLFAQSQAQIYEWTKTRYPALYKQIKQRVKEGKWVPIGGMWVEPDSNLPSGESLVRQILYGQQFFEDEFGIRSRTAWLPDTFGYSGALPQILKKSGIDYFASNKIFKNETNTFPYSTFWWRGIDGSEVLGHFFPAKRYDCRMEPAEFHKALREFVESDRSNDFIFSFGFSDGGGGPTKQMLENARIGNNLEGLPRMKYSPPEEFFKEVERTSHDLPTWIGEIYYELTRGTYTSEAKNKKFNRQCEFQLRDAEIACALGLLSGRSYPQESLVAQWKNVLLHQFHDVITGTSIREVFEDTDADYEKVLHTSGVIRDQALTSLIEAVDTRGDGIPIFVFNSLSWARGGVVEVPLPEKIKNGAVVTDEGAVLPCEIIGRGKKKRIRFVADTIPDIGYSVFRVLNEKKESPATRLSATPTKLENQHLRVRFDRKGLIRSIFDKTAKRELVPEGVRANVFQLFEDKPERQDAWDIACFYKDKGRDITEIESIEVVSEGPVEAAIRIIRKFSGSTLEQVIALGENSRRIDFRTRINWNESHQLLKVAFPTTLHKSTPARATYEIQYGHIERPTHWNTTWDRARFEVSAHRWADLSEYGYGAALLNDCKYGYDIKDNQLRLTLLKASKHPDTEADIGEHTFSYALLPHIGDFREAGVIHEGYEFNEPLIGMVTDSHDGKLPPHFSFINVDAPNVIIDCIKKAEKSDDLIVRVYEAFNSTTRATITLPQTPKGLWECNLVEQDISEHTFKENQFSFGIKPFEIKTFRIRFSKTSR